MNAANDTLNTRALSCLGFSVVLTALVQVGVVSFFGALTNEQPTSAGEAKPTRHEIQQLIIDRAQANDWFGFCVALDKQWALIGCPLQGNGNHPATGAGYLYHRSDRGGWYEVATLAPQFASRDSLFGWSVALDSKHALIGTCANTTEAANCPTAYLFQEDERGNWHECEKLLIEDSVAQEVFDVSVAMDSDTALIGRVWRDVEEDRSCGAAYLFQENSQGEWQQIAKFSADVDEASNFGNFGTAVALSGQRALIGAPTEDTTANGSGGAYIMQEESRGVWRQVARLCAQDAAGGDSFGICVALDGDTAVVGACGSDSAGCNSGAAYVFRFRGHRKWVQVAKITASDAAAWDCFGCAVAIDGEIVVVGSPGNNDGAGAAYVFQLDQNAGVKQIAKYTPNEGTAQARFARSIALSGKTLLAGAPWADATVEKSGAAYLFRLPD